jgi:hypothetical protein
MKNYLFFGFILLLISCNKEKINSDPNHYLSKEQQLDFKLSIVRYYEKLPTEKDNHQTKFDSIHDDYYLRKARNSDLMFLHVDADSTYYFAVTKIAPSLKLKKVAIIGKLRRDNSGKIIYYEEAIRTWKMEKIEPEKKTSLLFEKYVNKDELTPYYTKNSINEFYIEFPDDNNKYDTEKRQWVFIK